MMFKTHLVFGLLVGLFMIEYFNISEKVLFVSICVFSAVLADLDHPFSKLGNKVKPLSWLLNLLFGHRGFMHTVWFPFFIYFLFMVFDKTLWAGAFFLGYMSHLIMDMLSTRGVYFFFPLNRTRINGFIKVGGSLEWVVFIAILVGIGFLLFL